MLVTTFLILFLNFHTRNTAGRGRRRKIVTTALHCYRVGMGIGVGGWVRSFTALKTEWEVKKANVGKWNVAV